MHDQNRVVMFIHLLTEAFEEDRALRRAILEQQKNASVSRFNQFRRPTVNLTTPSNEPLDCVQLFSEQCQDMRNA